MKVWWCGEHNWNGWPDEDICLWVRVGRDQGAYNTPCRMVEMQLVPAAAELQCPSCKFVYEPTHV